MGFFDMHGGLGRKFGGLGLALDGIFTRIRFEAAGRLVCTGPNSERAQACAETLLHALGITAGLKIEVMEVIPGHCGLGSGTQLSLGIAAGIAEMFELSSDLAELARLLNRGVRSGIGMGAFAKGGFVVDGGRGEITMVPPVIAQLPFPEAWRVVLVLDRTGEGLSGHSEISAFRQLAPMAAERAGHLCRLVLMQILPALAEGNCPLFGDGITAVQEIVGDYFSQFQGGRYTSKTVANALAWMQAQGVRGVGQSSWGPTGFAIFASETEASEMAAMARSRMPETLEFRVCQANNEGAAVFDSDACAAGALRTLSGV